MLVARDTLKVVCLPTAIWNHQQIMTLRASTVKRLHKFLRKMGLRAKPSLVTSKTWAERIHVWLCHISRHMQVLFPRKDLHLSSVCSRRSPEACFFFFFLRSTSSGKTQLAQRQVFQVLNISLDLTHAHRSPRPLLNRQVCSCHTCNHVLTLRWIRWRHRDCSSLNASDLYLVVSACEFLSDVVFEDFPAEVFLQRPTIIKVNTTTILIFPRDYTGFYCVSCYFAEFVVASGHSQGKHTWRVSVCTENTFRTCSISRSAHSRVSRSFSVTAETRRYEPSTRCSCGAVVFVVVIFSDEQANASTTLTDASQLSQSLRSGDSHSIFVNGDMRRCGDGQDDANSASR